MFFLLRLEGLSFSYFGTDQLPLSVRPGL
jgi:hypothetical protein